MEIFMSYQLPLPGLSMTPVPAPAFAAMSTALADLHRFPAVQSEALQVHGKAIGLAAEHLIDSLLIRRGEIVLSAPESEHFDRVLLRDSRSVKIQIKARARDRGGRYTFRVARGFHGSASGSKDYIPGDFDIIALAALDMNAVYFTTERRKYYSLTSRQFRGLASSPYESLDAALLMLGLVPPGDAACG
jgi:hypothetical protein